MNTSNIGREHARKAIFSKFEPETAHVLWSTPFMQITKERRRFIESNPDLKRRVVELCKRRHESKEMKEDEKELLTFQDALNALQSEEKHLALEVRRQNVRGDFKDQFVHGDCREALKDLLDHSIKSVICDPPWGINYPGRHRKTLPNALPIVGDRSTGDAIALFNDALDELDKKLMDDSHLLVFCSSDNEPEWRQCLSSAGFCFARSMVWVKADPNQHCTGHVDRDGTVLCHDRILRYTRGNPGLVVPLSDVLYHKRTRQLSSHPTPKPLPLLEDLIRMTTVEGELVCDPSGGVGSTALAALRMGRRFFSAEIEEEYYKEGSARLEELRNSLNNP